MSEEWLFWVIDSGPLMLLEDDGNRGFLVGRLLLEGMLTEIPLHQLVWIAVSLNIIVLLLYRGGSWPDLLGLKLSHSHGSFVLRKRGSLFLALPMMVEVIGEEFSVWKTVKEFEEVRSVLRIGLKHLFEDEADQGVALVELLELLSVVFQFL